MTSQSALPLTWGTTLSDVVDTDHAAYGFLTQDGSCPVDRDLRGIRETKSGTWIQNRKQTYSTSLDHQVLVGSDVIYEILNESLAVSQHMMGLFADHNKQSQRWNYFDPSSMSAEEYKIQALSAEYESALFKNTYTKDRSFKKEPRLLKTTYSFGLQLFGASELVLNPAFLESRTDPIDDLSNRVTFDFGFFLGRLSRSEMKKRPSGRFWIHASYIQDANDGGYNLDADASWFCMTMPNDGNPEILVLKYSELKSLPVSLAAPWCIWATYAGECKQDSTFKRLQANLLDQVARQLPFRFFGPVFSYWAHLWMFVYGLNASEVGDFHQKNVRRVLMQLMMQRSKPAFMSAVFHDILFKWNYARTLTSFMMEKLDSLGRPVQKDTGNTVVEDLESLKLSKGFYKNLWRTIEGECGQILEQIDIPPDPEWGVIDLEDFDANTFDTNLGHNSPAGLVSTIVGVSTLSYRLYKDLDDINVIHTISAQIAKLSVDTIKGYWVKYEVDSSDIFIQTASRCAFPKTKIWDMVIKDKLCLVDPDNLGFPINQLVSTAPSNQFGYDVKNMVDEMDRKEPDWPAMVDTRRVKNHKDLHDEITKIYNAIKYKPTPISLEVSYPFMPSHRVPIPGTSYVLVAAKDTNEIREWGQKQGHCVGSYADRVVNAETCILGIFDTKTNDWAAHIQLQRVPPSLEQCCEYIANVDFWTGGGSDINTKNRYNLRAFTSIHLLEQRFKIQIQTVLGLSRWNGYRAPEMAQFDPIKTPWGTLTHSLDKVTGTATPDLQSRIAKIMEKFFANTSPLDFVDASYPKMIAANAVIGEKKGKEVKEVLVEWGSGPPEITINQFYGKHNASVDDKLCREVSLALGDLIAKFYMPKRLQDMIDAEIELYLEELRQNYTFVPRPTFFTGVSTEEKALLSAGA